MGAVRAQQAEGRYPGALEAMAAKVALGEPAAVGPEEWRMASCSKDQNHHALGAP